MPLAIVSLIVMLIALACAILVLRHAFLRSVGTGVMVLCLPFFIIYYAFSQFEHPRKGLVLAGCFGGAFAALALRILSLSA